MKAGIVFHPGHYNFRFPYFSWVNIPGESNQIKAHYCDVKVIIGDQRDLDEGKLITVVIYPLPKTIGTTNQFSTIASGIRNSVIRSIFHEYHHRDEPYSPEDIRWVEVYTKEYIGNLLPDGDCREIHMTWDNMNRVYSGYNSEKVELEERYYYISQK